MSKKPVHTVPSGDSWANKQGGKEISTHRTKDAAETKDKLVMKVCTAFLHFTVRKAVSFSYSSYPTGFAIALFVLSGLSQEPLTRCGIRAFAMANHFLPALLIGSFAFYFSSGRPLAVRFGMSLFGSLLFLNLPGSTGRRKQEGLPVHF